MQFKPITVIAVLLLVVASLLVAGCTSSNTSTNDQTTSASATPSVQSDKTTFSSDKGYSITYPATWEKSVAAAPPVDVYLYVSPNEKANGVVVGTEGLTSGMTLNDFVNAQITNIKNYNSAGVYKNLAILSETNSTLSGKPAHTIVFSGVFPVQYSTTTTTNKSLKIMQTFVVNDNTGYVISYKAIQSDYDKYLTLAAQAINSFTFTTITPPISVTATSIGSSNSLSSSYGTPTAAATNNKFVTYAVYFQNLNKKDLDMGNPTEIKLRDTSGNIYSYDSFTYSLQQQVNGVTLKGLTSQSNTQPGDKYSGLITFQIPASATPKSLTYDDYTNKITINL
jgi:hypothetical protein